MIDVKLLSSFGKSDHVSMKIELGVSLGKESPPETNVIKKPNWSKVSVNDILDYSYNNIDWYPTSRSLCSQEIWDQLYDNLCKFNARQFTSSIFSITNINTFRDRYYLKICYCKLPIKIL